MNELVEIRKLLERQVALLEWFKEQKQKEVDAANKLIASMQGPAMTGTRRGN